MTNRSWRDSSLIFMDIVIKLEKLSVVYFFCQALHMMFVSSNSITAHFVQESTFKPFINPEDDLVTKGCKGCYFDCCVSLCSDGAEVTFLASAAWFTPLHHWQLDFLQVNLTPVTVTLCYVHTSIISCSSTLLRSFLLWSLMLTLYLEIQKR